VTIGKDLFYGQRAASRHVDRNYPFARFDPYEAAWSVRSAG
jgi:hypothetical protein